MAGDSILHETATRLRLAVEPKADLYELELRMRALRGVEAVRVNETLRCLVVQHDGQPDTRTAVLDQLHGRLPASPRVQDALPVRTGKRVPPWTPAAIAASVPALPASWRPSAALAAIATRLVTQTDRLRADPPAAALDATSLAALALSGQAIAASASVVLRWLTELTAARLVQEANELLAHLMPAPADQYQVLREPSDDSLWSWFPLRSLRAGDRVRLFAGDTVPVDAWVIEGSGTMAPGPQQQPFRSIAPGDHVTAGERLHNGTLEILAEADPASSRLGRMRAHVMHAIRSRDPAGRISMDAERPLTLAVTAAALVYGFTGDAARAATMLQADPARGLDLDVPLEREAALYAMARHGMLASGLEAIDRLAIAPTLVLQDMGVLATGRWTIEWVQSETNGDAQRVKEWLAALANIPVEVLDRASFPDQLVRQWVRHGAVLRVGDHEVHLTSRARLRQVWGMQLDSDLPAQSEQRLQREFAVVEKQRVVARVVFVSPLRPGALEQIEALAALGFQRIAVFAERDGSGHDTSEVVITMQRPPVISVPDHFGLRSDWLTSAVSDGSPLVMVHTVLRDLLPPGSLSLTPIDADAGSHGVLLGDPLASLVAARKVAMVVHRRHRLHQMAAAAVNAAAMTASALRWIPPAATALIHHGFALMLLLDSVRVESLGNPLHARTGP